MFISLSPSILNIFDATPDSDFIPAPIIDTLAIFWSTSNPPAFNFSDICLRTSSTSSCCSEGAVKEISVIESFETF